jgi:uncharacterized protein GlcG (DUF336 family)
MLTLAQPNRIIAAVLTCGVELQCRPLSVIVVEPGCKVKAFQKEDGSSMIRFKMALGKAYAALALGRSSRLVHHGRKEGADAACDLDDGTLHPMGAKSAHLKKSSGSRMRRTGELHLSAMTPCELSEA